MREGTVGTPSCTDGLDNDRDGYIDATDTGCGPVPPPLMCNAMLVTIVDTLGITASPAYPATMASMALAVISGRCKSKHWKGRRDCVEGQAVLGRKRYQAY